MYKLSPIFLDLLFMLFSSHSQFFDLISLRTSQTIAKSESSYIETFSFKGLFQHLEFRTILSSMIFHILFTSFSSIDQLFVCEKICSMFDSVKLGTVSAYHHLRIFSYSLKI